ncbi:MAG: hypothetical protein ABJH04_20285 [Cyclobacteriaceae bacterium]
MTIGFCAHSISGKPINRLPHSSFIRSSILKQERIISPSGIHHGANQQEERSMVMKVECLVVKKYFFMIMEEDMLPGQQMDGATSRNRVS